MNFKPSRVLERIKGGYVATCTKLNTYDSRVAAIAALAGFDCIWVDLEHVPNSISDIEKLILASKAYNTDIITRVKRGSYSDLIHPLESDSTGIMVPHVMSLDDAKTIQYYTKFHPIGRRPLDSGNADGLYGMKNTKEYMEFVNKNRFIALQIEDPEPLDELEQICQLPGADMIFFGPADFSQGIGAPCVWDNPKIEKTRKLIAKKARENGKIAGTVGSINNIDALVSEGYNFISVGADVIGLGEYFMNISNKVKDKKAI
ncbi:MAG TPA: aldolase/citrate lyase family protein [Clostridia bacterium]|nr:aldolase/citrate lyase family protein [Clostridia bacterium]